MIYILFNYIIYQIFINIRILRQENPQFRFHFFFDTIGEPDFALFGVVADEYFITATNYLAG